MIGVGENGSEVEFEIKEKIIVLIAETDQAPGVELFHRKIDGKNELDKVQEA